MKKKICSFLCFFNKPLDYTEFTNKKRIFVNNFIKLILPNIIIEQDYIEVNSDLDVENLKIILNNNREKFIEYVTWNEKIESNFEFLYTTENFSADFSNIFYVKENILWVNIAIQDTTCCIPTHIPIYIDLTKKIF